MNHRVGQIFVEACLDEGRSPPVDGSVAQQRKAESDARFAGALGAALFVVGQQAAGGDAIASEESAAPEAGELLEARVDGGALIIPTGSVEESGKELKIEGAARALEASGGDIAFDECGQHGRVLLTDRVEHFVQRQRVGCSRAGGCWCRTGRFRRL